MRKERKVKTLQLRSGQGLKSRRARIKKVEDKTMNLKELALSVEQIAEEKGIKKEKAIEAVESALAAVIREND